MTLHQKSFQRPTECWKRARKLKKPHRKCLSENYKSAAPSGERLEAITVANQMHRTTLLISLNTGRYVLPEERRHIHKATEGL